MSNSVLCVIGTRPEAIKMAPVIRALRASGVVQCRVLLSGQHRELLQQTLADLQLNADIELDCMRPGQSLASLTARVLEALDQVLSAERPDVVLAQGDTTTVMCAALASFYQRIPFGHIEAGLRTYDLAGPFPEEANRLIATRLARWHFAPTQSAVDNLRNEGIAAAAITLTGNTGIDALLQARPVPLPAHLQLDPQRRLLLVTLHRRENIGERLPGICQALAELAAANPDIQIVFPVHPNPQIRDGVLAQLSNSANVLLCEALDYGVFVTLMKRAYLVLTDSGGVQEEAPALGVPVLVLRAHTERPEAVALGAAQVIGTQPQRIVWHTQRLLDDRALHAATARAVSPYGDGQSAQRICSVLLHSLGLPDLPTSQPRADESRIDTRRLPVTTEPPG